MHEHILPRDTAEDYRDPQPTDRRLGACATLLVDTLPPRHHPDNTRLLWSAEKQAVAVLNECIDVNYPVDVEAIARVLGITVYYGDGSLFDGPRASVVVIKVTGQDALMYINDRATVGAVRHRFARGIGYYLYYTAEHRQSQREGLTPKDAGATFGYVRLLETDIAALARESGSERPEDIFAGAFARALLIPRERINKFFDFLYQDYTEEEGAAYFGTTIPQLRRRLEELGERHSPFLQG